MVMPNFLIIGAPRSGTTSLHRYLQQHPQIFMSDQKELRFFAFEGQSLSFKGPFNPPKFHTETITNLDRYQEQFKNVSTEKCIGESSPIYLWWPNVAERIHHYLPDVKLIAILRNPVERAYSDFLNMRQLGWEPLRNFTQALQQEEKRIQAEWGPFYYYKSKGFYYKYLQSYLLYFSLYNIHICFYEDLVQDSKEVIKNILLFLEADTLPLSQIKFRAFNASNSGRRKSGNFLQRFIANTVSSNATTVLSLEARKYLIEIYREDILNLQSLVKRDLSSWLN